MNRIEKDDDEYDEDGNLIVQVCVYLILACKFLSYGVVCISVFYDQGWGAGCFWILGAGAAGKKSQEPEPPKICRLLSPARR